MGKKTRKIVKLHRLKEKRDSKYAGNHEASPYWNHLAGNHEGHEMANDGEPLRANPDSLVEGDSGPSTPQLIMGEAIEHLQGRQKEVYLLTMREDKSLAETAKILGIEKASAQVYKDRAIKFIGKYCKQAMDKGRV